MSNRKDRHKCRISVSVDPVLKERAAKHAEEEGRTLSSMVCWLLKKHVEEVELLAKKMKG